MRGQRPHNALLDSARQIAFQRLISRVVFELGHHDIILTGNRNDVINESGLIAQRCGIAKQMIEFVDKLAQEVRVVALAAATASADRF